MLKTACNITRLKYYVYYRKLMKIVYDVYLIKI